MSAQKPEKEAKQFPEEVLIVDLLQRVKGMVGNAFPGGKLENRLLNLGLEEFIKVPAKDKDKTLRRYGFPFKFSGQLDEAILVLAHFLDRFRDEGGTLNIYVLNNLSNGDDAGLSYWQSAKAKLYLELQNLILQLNGLKWTEITDDENEVTFKWTSHITRIFTFRKMVDIAYLTQPAISAMIEQLATGIELGFLFSETFIPPPQHGYARRSTGSLFPNTMLVDFTPARKKHIHDFFILQDQTDSNYLPYQERCKAKWFPNLKKAIFEDKSLKGFLNIFNTDNWEPFGNKQKVCHFEERGTEYFNKAAVMLYEAFRNSDIAREMRDESEDADQYIVDKINGTVITDDFMEIQRTMSVFDEAEDICAVDASSTKKSLKVHEYSPIYRQWIRKSLNRALNPKHVLKTQGKSLNRIYILKDTHEEKDIEFASLLRILQYYFDYYRYDISEMDGIVKVQPSSLPRPPKEPLPWLEDYWSSLRNRIHIFITTSSILKHVTDHLDRNLLARILSDAFSPATVSPDDVHSYLIKLDYLFTGKMIYNYRNPRATPAEGREEAFIYRSGGTANLAAESNIVFKFGEELTTFTDIQTRDRMNSLLKVLEKYQERHFDICKEFKEVVNGTKTKAKIAEIKAKLQAGEALALGDSQDLLAIRLEYERTLHHHFKPKFDFLHRLLETFSVEVQFFDAANTDSIRNVYPFKNAKSLTAVNNLIQKEIQRKRALMEQLNAELNSLVNGEKLKNTESDKTSEQRIESYDVFISYRWTSPDQEWVRDELYEKLLEAGVRVILDVEDFVPGRDLILEMERAGNESRHVLCVITPKYFEEGRMVEFENLSARRRDPGGRNSFLIPLILTQADIPDRIRGLVPIDWTNPKYHAREWRKLLRLLKAPNQNVSPPRRVD